MSSQRIKSAVLTGTTQVLPLGDIALPFTIVLLSADATRAISLSFDGGVEYFTPAVDQTSATQRVLHVTVPCTHVKFTGIVGNTGSVIWNKSNI